LPSAYFPCAHSAEAVATAMEWAARGWLKSRPLITHTFRPEEAETAYGMMAAGSEDFLGIVFDWRAGK
jgi:3-hydroxyethyl bacteriochlorophyllide a dehydrogenase